MRVLCRQGDDDLACVYVAETADGARIEFVESVQPPVPREEKWVLIVSTLKGCPVKCAICDAGGSYRGRLSAEEILTQIEHLILRRFPDGRVPVPKLKVQFARMGDPALNDAVLEVLEALPRRFTVPGLMPCISTIAPAGREAFFERLLELKQALYGGGRFQLQFSIHTTDPALRDTLIPVRKWDLAAIASYGDAFFAPGDRKITLNAALPENAPLDADVLAGYFDPRRFLIKITPVNPTYQARHNGLRSYLAERRDGRSYEIIENLRRAFRFKGEWISVA